MTPKRRQNISLLAMKKVRKFFSSACATWLKRKINCREILERVAELPIQKWAFKQNAEIRHIGPMAQDFPRCFQPWPG
jgi:hypothetical protein